MKRFYKTVSVSPDNTVLLDGRPVKTPAHNALRLPSRALAEAVAAEWRAQGADINTHATPLTKLANTAIDRVATLREEVIEQILAFGGSDLLCYRAEEPAALASRQHREWQPVLDWGRDRFGLALQTSMGVIHVSQPPDAFIETRAYLEGRSDHALAGIHAATGLLGSLVLALALHDGHLDAKQAFGLSRLDEEFQAEQWGRDAEADARAAAHAAELTAIAQFLSLSKA